MNKLIPIFALFVLISSCSNEAERAPQDKEINKELIKVAENIIYDVVVETDSDDAWEMEKVAGYAGEEMINDLFEGLYSGILKARDYHSGKELSARDIKLIEKQEGFERSNIAKIQFTEDWYYNPATKDIEKEIVLLVFGYKTLTEDLAGEGYMASFEIIFE